MHALVRPGTVWSGIRSRNDTHLGLTAGRECAGTQVSGQGGPDDRSACACRDDRYRGAHRGAEVHRGPWPDLHRGKPRPAAAPPSATPWSRAPLPTAIPCSSVASRSPPPCRSIRNLPYDPVRDLAPVGSVGQSFYVLAVHPSVPVHSVQEFIKLARTKAKSRSAMRPPAAGTITHLTVELFQANTKIEYAARAVQGRRAGDTRAGQRTGRSDLQPDRGNPAARARRRQGAHACRDEPEAGTRPSRRSDPRRVGLSGLHRHYADTACTRRPEHRRPSSSG